ncbi:MAG: hypothetical protein AAB910_03585, partial [Patescibacteria group bacterium]
MDINNPRLRVSVVKFDGRSSGFASFIDERLNDPSVTSEERDYFLEVKRRLIGEPDLNLDETHSQLTPQPADIHYTEVDILQRYEFGEELANTERGGQGTVLRAKRKSDGLDVVVKIYSGKETGDWDKILHEE